MNATRGIPPKRKSIMVGRKGFMAEGKPGFPDAYDLRLLNNERRKNELLGEEVASLRKEISRLNRKAQDMRALILLAVKKIFKK